MASLSDVYGSGKFIKADAEGCIDIEGKPYEKVVTIVKTHVHEFPPEKGGEEGKKQIVLTFRELPEMELGLNITNARSIGKLAGTEDWEKWAGTVIELCVVPEEKSKTGHAIRIRKPRTAPAAGAPGQAPVITRLGPMAAKRLLDRCEAEKRDLALLRTHLAQRFPQFESALASDPAMWPVEIGKEVAVWFATPTKNPIGMTEEEIPF